LVNSLRRKANVFLRRGRFSLQLREEPRLACSCISLEMLLKMLTLGAQPRATSEPGELVNRGLLLLDCGCITLGVTNGREPVATPYLLLKARDPLLKARDTVLTHHLGLSRGSLK
jgi:hypothetical protein